MVVEMEVGVMVVRGDSGNVETNFPKSHMSRLTSYIHMLTFSNNPQRTAPRAKLLASVSAFPRDP